MKTKRCSMCYETKPMSEFYPTNGKGRFRSECKGCKNTAARSTGYRNWENSGYHHKGVAAEVFKTTLKEYEWKLQAIDVFGLNMDNVEDTAEINRVLSLFKE